MPVGLQIMERGNGVSLGLRASPVVATAAVPVRLRPSCYDARGACGPSDAGLPVGVRAEVGLPLGVELQGEEVGLPLGVVLPPAEGEPGCLWASNSPRKVNRAAFGRRSPFPGATGAGRGGMEPASELMREPFLPGGLGWSSSALP